MLELLQSFLYLSGSLTVVFLLLLPLLFLLSISVVYIVAETIWRFRWKRGLF